MPLHSEQPKHVAQRAGALILELPEFMWVRFEGSSTTEVAAVYRALADRLLLPGRSRVLVQSSGRAHEGHYALRDVLRTLMRSSGRTRPFRFALCSMMPRIKRVFGQIQKEFRNSGFEIRVFDNDAEAASWCLSTSGMS